MPEPLQFSTGPIRKETTEIQTSISSAQPQTHRPPSPVPSGVSLKSDQSLPEPPTFSSGPVPSGMRPQTHRPPSPVPSGVSLKSDQSMPEPPTFSSGPVPSGMRPQTHRPPSPVPSGVSLKSDWSMPEPPTFSSGPVPSGMRPQTHRPPSPVPSGVSLKSDQSMPEPPTFSSGPVPSGMRPQTHRPPSPVPSGVSLKSDQSLPEPPTFSSGPVPSGMRPQTHRPPSPVPSGVSLKSDQSLPEPPTFSSGPVPSGMRLRADLTQDQSSCGVCEQVLRDPVITTCGHSFCRQCISSYWEQPGLPGDQACPQCGKTCRTQPPLQPPVDKHMDKGTQDESLRRVIKNHKASLKRRFENISEGIIKPGAEILLNKIYTELYITEGETEGVNKEHEVWQVESASRSQSTVDTPINCNDIFKPLLGQEKHIKTVMTKGVAGIGKTVSVQKFILDWTDGIANQNIDFMFPLSFRELNLVRDDQYSFHRLLLDFHPELKELKDSDVYKDCQVVFIFDGLDESRLTLDLEQNSKLSDVKQTSSVDVLMTSLIQGTLLPSALIWITSRPAAASQIPTQFIDQVTEVRGFNDTQKEEYFRKRISDESKANRVISHIQASRSLHIMCHIPVFCWIAATVLQQMLERKNIKDIPKTLTEMFIHFLLIQTTRKDQKYQSGPATDKKKLLESQRNILLKLAELAFKNLENGNLMFYEEDLRECGIEVSEASVYSGMCTEIFKTEPVESQQKKVYCFVHLSVQEFLAAVFVFHSYLDKNHTALKTLISDERRDELNPSKLYTFQSALGLKSQDDLHVLLKSAVDKALESQNGHLDLFLRFLMGISVERNHKLLRGLLSNKHNRSHSIKETCQYIKKLNREGLSPERCINLFHCLFEMNDDSMHREIQTYLSSPKNIKQKLSPAHCSALAHMLLMSEDVLDEIDLKKYNTSDEGRRRLIPAVRCCRKAQLAECKLSDKSCGIVATVLQSPNSLIELDLSHNDLGDYGVQLISKGLSSPNCKLQTLRLSKCGISDEGYVCLALALMLNPSCVKELDVNNNHPGESAQKLLSATLDDPHHKVEALQFADCKLTDKSCEIVASVLQSPNSLLQLDLSHNDLGDSGVQLLSKGLSSFNSNIHTLRLSDCLISEKGCGFLASALTSNPSHLLELDLSYNHPGESGLKLLSARLEDPVCKLEILKTDHASVSRARPRLRRYACDLTLDPNTAHRNLSLSEGNRKVTHVNKQQPYPEHPERFDLWSQVLCREGLTGRCYWEAEWSGDDGAAISVAYKSIKRKGDSADVIMGQNAKSWSLSCIPHSYSVWHNNEETAIPAPSSGSSRVGVHLDWPAGTLSFYSVSSHTLTHLHTFHSTFTEPLYPGFWVWDSVSLCQIT
ncbi:NACHT, LRR and PYD domains-containing protein 3-like isoform X2 [Sardina pilchardus]|uniref:NACHT, LRR and PYD domains-containing protein 3-like isoform X2 n=1 Tax=Sardina pilchardus TaxID=27697 RepID=UPI002E110C04